MPWGSAGGEVSTPGSGLDYAAGTEMCHTENAGFSASLYAPRRQESSFRPGTASQGTTMLHTLYQVVPCAETVNKGHSTLVARTRAEHLSEDGAVGV